MNYIDTDKPVEQIDENFIARQLIGVQNYGVVQPSWHQSITVPQIEQQLLQVTQVIPIQ